ncbi:gastrin/cholecystokinin type B receptor-like [Uloborus diversus]|uniref:gastrin/cholecystokinin type B receptor-like n=1 Tax=Uloborus diversus TaxID=327109 RepID=UPI00240A99E4|nr:gastrin/cholecystokinin type B receptor-like [Uloborus diversus]
MSFDTTASNTGHITAACVAFQERLGKALFGLACRHHIGEIILSHVFDDLKIEVSKSLDISVLKRFRKHYTILQFVEERKYKCREEWPDAQSERIFNIYLDVVLLVIPLLIMIIFYSLIARKLCIGSKLNFNKGKRTDQNGSSNPERQYLNPLRPSPSNGLSLRKEIALKIGGRNKTTKGTPLRGSYEKNQAAKTRVVRMLFVVVVEFFLCWTPLYVVNTWALFDAKTIYSSLGYVGISVIHLLAYVSSCCNPLTYCFMHKKYRQGFLAVIGCKKNKRWHFGGQNSERSGTMRAVPPARFARLPAIAECGGSMPPVVISN